MKANKLMIGDWVRVNDTEHAHPLQVAEIFKKSGAYYATLYWDGMPDNVNPETLTADIDKVLPIPLTPEILEKNDLKIGNVTEYLGYDIYSDEEGTFGVSEEREGFVFETYKRWEEKDCDGAPIDWGFYPVNRIKGIRYFHELQHA